MQVLVTGGGGFVGSHIVTELVHQGHQVRVLDNFLTGRRENLNHVLGELELIEGSITDPDTARRAVADCSVVFHEAALPSVPRSVADPWTSNHNNIDGTLNILIAARDAGVGRFVYASSSSAYGNTDVLPKTETMPGAPLSPYAITKYVGELYGQAFHRVYGLPTVALRYFNVFGPRQNPASQYSAVIPRFITSLLRGESPVIYGDGEQTRDFTFVANVVQANLDAAAAPEAAVAGRVFNVGCGSRISLNALVAELNSILNSDITPVYQPERLGDVRDSQADIHRAQEAFGYNPSVSLRRGLEITVDWFRQQML